MKEIEVVFSGPLFDGRLVAKTEAALEESIRQTADYCYDELEGEFHQNFKNPTGFYESRLVTKKVPEGMSVNDQGVIYGPWLEGTSRRNQTTRFKGYSNFRRVTQRAKFQAYKISGAVFAAVFRGL